MKFAFHAFLEERRRDGAGKGINERRKSMNVRTEKNGQL